MGAQVNQPLTDEMVERAIAECADAHFAGSTRRLRQALLQGQCEHCHCLNASLVRQIAAYLVQMDRTVKAIYQVQPATFPKTAGEGRINDPPLGYTESGINLLVWVERKSAALGALVETLDKVLSASKRKIDCPNRSSTCFTLDVQMVDDRDVKERRGFGNLVEFNVLHSTPIWERNGSEGAEIVEVEDLARVRFGLPDSFDPELIPEGRLIDHALTIERIPATERAALEHHLTELKVILIRRMISDQLAYIDIAKNWLTISDLNEVYQRRIGFGRVGGKAAGMLLAKRILIEMGDDEIRNCLQVPESYYLGSDLIYIFMAMNGLMYWNDQKYKPDGEIWADYPKIQEEFEAGSFPPEILMDLQELLEKVGGKPLIVRSSSQLEDNFGTSFAGKYDSYYCPNQGTIKENLAALTRAIAGTYASTLKPEALLYRRSKGLQDYDERMAALIQVVQGEQFGKYFLPHGSGVAFSRNLYRWSPEISKESGFVRLVWGLGTRAVQRVGDDYPRLVALSHPTLLPDDSSEAIRHYSQHYVDTLDLEANEFRTLAIQEVLTPGYPPLRLVAQLEQEGSFKTPRMRVQSADIPRLAITFHELLKGTAFASVLERMLHLLEVHFRTSVDVEFTVHLPDLAAVKPPVQIYLLQCRPQSYLQDTVTPRLPEGLLTHNILFSTRFMVPQGYVKDIRYLVFIKPDAYFVLPDAEKRSQVGQTIARLNGILGSKTFICIGPGRWGSTNHDLGVYVSYADIHNAAALIELSGKGIGPAPEPSFGTHFFQDLMEAQIYPLAVNLDDENVRFNRHFFHCTYNSLPEYVEVDQAMQDCIRLIDINKYRCGCHCELVMDDERGEALAFLVEDSPPGSPIQ